MLPFVGIRPQDDHNQQRLDREVLVVVGYVLKCLIVASIPQDHQCNC